MAGRRHLHLRRALARQDALERVQRAEQLGYDSTYVDPHRRPRLAHGADGLCRRQRADQARHRRAADLLADAGRDGPAGRHDRRVLGRPDGARARRLPSGHRRELVRQPSSTGRCARCASTSAIVRACFRGEDPPQGEIFQQPLPLHGLRAARRTCRSTSPRLSPKMLRLAGRDRRRGDAVALQPRLHPRGRRARGHGRGASGPASRSTASTSSPPCPPPSPTTRQAAFETMRADLITYWSLPFYRAMIERSGFGDDIAAFDAGMQAGDVERAKAAISDRFLDALTAIGSPDEVRAGHQALRATPAPPRPASAPSRAPTSTPRWKPQRPRSLTLEVADETSCRDGSPLTISHYRRKLVSGSERHPRASPLWWGRMAGGLRLGRRWHSIASPRAAAEGRPRPPDRGPAGLGHRSLQLPLPVLHARRGPAVARPRRAPHLRGDRAPGAAARARWASRDVRLTGGEPLVRRELPDADRDAGRDRGPRRPLADDQRLPARADGGRPRRRGPAAHQRLARLALARPLLPDDPPRLAAAGDRGARGARALSAARRR